MFKQIYETLDRAYLFAKDVCSISESNKTILNQDAILWGIVRLIDTGVETPYLNGFSVYDKVLQLWRRCESLEKELIHLMRQNQQEKRGEYNTLPNLETHPDCSGGFYWSPSEGSGGTQI